MKKLFKILSAVLVAASLASCGVNGSNNNNNNSNNTGNGTGNSCGTCTGGEIDLDAINDYFLNDEHWADMTGSTGYGNKVTFIPFTHINGPKAEWNFFAMVNFEYDNMTYFKYQVTYLSCTCRDASVNYWQTAYVELTVPSSGELKDVKLRTLSFENDGKNNDGHYIAGFWGDSGTNGHDIEGSGVYYEDIRDAFIPYLVNKNYEQLSSFDGYVDPQSGYTYDDTVFGMDPDAFKADMDGVLFHGEQVELDDFNGASVSTNNILRMVLALMEYHGANNI